MKIIITEQQHKLIKESIGGKYLRIDMSAIPGETNEERTIKLMKMYDKYKEAKGWTGIHVMGNFHIVGATIKRLNDIKIVDGNFVCRFSFIEDLGDLEYVGGDMSLVHSDRLKSLGKVKIIKGELDVRGCDSLKDLGELEKVKTINSLETTKVTSLGNLREINYLWGGNDVDIAENLESLGELRKVSKYLDLGKSKIKTLGNLEYVGDWLNLTDSQVEDLGDLKFVGSNMSIWRTPLLNKFDPNEIEDMVEIVGILNY